ncbi:MAG: hypothetical protein KIH62_001895 [Candidatus Kerfeldbacteria bacterium]|nr:hypothetical protein [Candidatus Kerfeldbacteria bacterium]
MVDTELTPQVMYQQLESELRRLVRFKMSAQYQMGAFPLSEIRQRLKDEALLKTDFHIQGGGEGVDSGILRNGWYYIGPRYILAYARAEHGGNLREAITVLAHTTGLRLAGHMLMHDVDQTKFHLTSHIPEDPVIAQVSRKRFPPAN